MTHVPRATTKRLNLWMKRSTSVDQLQGMDRSPNEKQTVKPTIIFLSLSGRSCRQIVPLFESTRIEKLNKNQKLLFIGAFEFLSLPIAFRSTIAFLLCTLRQLSRR